MRQEGGHLGLSTLFGIFLSAVYPSFNISFLKEGTLSLREVSYTLLNSTKEYIRQINPFLYRGYYYDKESSLYYLLSIYYDPSEGVLLTIDDINMTKPRKISGLDLYCYCRHNPVMHVNSNGRSILLTTILSFLLFVAKISAFMGIIEYYKWDSPSEYGTIR